MQPSVWVEAGRWRAAVLEARCSACGEPAADAAQRFCSACGAAIIAPWRQPQSLWTTLDQNDRDARIRRLEARSHTPLDAVGRSGLVAVFVAEGDLSRARSVACSAGDLPDVAQLRSERSLAAAYALATHPEATDDELRRLASNWGDDIALTVARNPLAPHAVLEALAEEHGIQGWLAVAANPGAPRSAFQPPGASPTIRRALLTNPSIPAELMLSILDAETRSPSGPALQETQVSITSNLACPSALWDLAAQSEDPAVRRALIDNPAAPEERKALAALV